MAKYRTWKQAGNPVVANRQYFKEICMKKSLVIGLALLILGSALFADDAKVMPLRTGRLSLAPSFTYGQKSFDDEGTRQDADTLKAFNFGAALEFGILSWITGAVQWAPGINAWSNVDTQVPLPSDPSGATMSTSDIRVFDVGDLFVGAKIQLFGKDAPLKSDKIRLAFAPGVKIPLPGPDYEEQYNNADKGDKVTAANMDNHVLGLGLRSYLDYIVNDKFFINFYNEIIYYPVKGKLTKAGYTEYALTRGMNSLNAMAAGASLPEIFTYDKVDFGADITFEIEPVFSTPIGGVLFSASIPITYKMGTGKTYDVTYNPTGVSALDVPASGIDQAFQNMTDMTHSLSVTPGVAFMFYKWKMPFEFEVDYKAPIWGMGTKANHTFIFKTKAFFKI